MNVNLEAMQKRLEQYREAAEHLPHPGVSDKIIRHFLNPEETSEDDTTRLADRIVAQEKVRMEMESTLADFWVDFNERYPEPEVG